MIVTLSDLDLFIHVVKASTDAMGIPKIKRRCIDLARRTQGNTGRAHRQISIGRDGEVVIENVAAGLDA